MKYTRLWKYILLVIITGIISFTSIPVHASGVDKECFGSTRETGRVVWRYTYIKGQLHRRMFNLDTGEWEGDWELVP